MRLTNDCYLITLHAGAGVERYFRDGPTWIKRSMRGRRFEPTAEQVLNHLLPALAGVKPGVTVTVEHMDMSESASHTLDNLRELSATARPSTPGPSVLFVCVHNAGRSQMAAGLLAHYAGGRVIVRSAGSDPGDRINPAAVRVMSEIGIDLSREFPKPLTDEFVQAADVVITMGCGDACPIYPGKGYEDWEVEDPAGKSVEEVRRIRDDLAERVRALIAAVAPA